MSAKFTPTSNYHVKLEVNGEELDTFTHREIADVMEKVASAYPGQSVLILKSGGFHAVENAVEAALDLAGLDGLAAAKATASGRIEF